MLVPQGAMRQARAQVSGKQLLQQLIEGARKEGQIDWFPVPDLKTEDVRAVAQVFNKRFGLNIRLKRQRPFVLKLVAGITLRLCRRKAQDLIIFQ